jgi:hypothetical protein
MATPTSRALGALLGTLSLAACASRPAGAPTAAALAATRPVIAADNQGREWLDVYLVQESGDVYLGRLAPGQTSRLTLPASALGGPAMVRLAVVAGAGRMLQPSRSARAVLSVQQPVGALLGQRWTFTQGQLLGAPPRPR